MKGIHPVESVVNKVVDVVDMDGIVRKIDIKDLIKRIDVNDAVSRIDFNEVLSTIDWDTQLERIDLDSIIRKIDTNSILMRSSTGIFTTSLDTLRTQLVQMDLYLRIVTRCRFWKRQQRQRMYLPPRPGAQDRETIGFSQSYRSLGAVQQQRHSLNQDVRYPKGRSNKAVAVQGRYCGFFSKAIAILVDNVFITFTFALLFRMIEWGLVLFLQASSEDASKAANSLKDNSSWYMLVIYCSLWFSYFFLMVGLMGHTFGMMLMGLRVANHSRKSNFYDNSHILSVTMTQAFVRTLFLPLTLTLFPPLGLFGAFRRDGRMLHDYLANTGIIYLWDAKMAKLRRKAVEEQDLDGISSSLASSAEGTDELDRLMGDDDDDDDDSSVGSLGRQYYAQFHDSIQDLSSTSLGTDDSTDVMANTPDSSQNSGSPRSAGQEVMLRREYQVKNNNAHKLVHVGSSSNVSDLTASYHPFPPRDNAKQQQRKKSKKRSRRKILRRQGRDCECKCECKSSSTSQNEHANCRIQ